MTALKETISHTATQHRQKRHNDLQLKLKNCRQYREKYSNTTENWVKNISSRKLTDEELHLLSKGMNYNTKDARQTSRLHCRPRPRSEIQQNRGTYTANNIRHEIASHLNIIILPADKGRTTVVWTKPNIWTRQENYFKTHLPIGNSTKTQ